MSCSAALTKNDLSLLQVAEPDRGGSEESEEEEDGGYDKLLKVSFIKT